MKLLIIEDEERLAGFLGAPHFGIRVFDPEQTRVLTTLLLLHDLLAPEAPSTEADPERRARRVVAQAIHGGVRWNMVTCSASLATSGANWKALAPVPITRILLPFRSCSCSHSVEWKEMPLNFS